MNIQNALGAVSPVTNQDARIADVLGSEAWVAHCRPVEQAGPVTLDDHTATAKARALPAGITYLSQLMAHDIFMSVSRRNAFVPRGKAASPTINLIETPLMLSTLYGRTGVAEQVIYSDFEPSKFDLFLTETGLEEDRVPVFLRDPRQSWSYPALADGRNFDNPILTQVALEFMRFHNRRVDELLAQGVGREEAFAPARAITLRTWHNIIQGEILKGTCRTVPGDYKFPPKLKRQGALTDRTFMAHVALRCFHALVQDTYRFRPDGAMHSISSMLSEPARGPGIIADEFPWGLKAAQMRQIDMWREQWEADWSLFFDNAGGSASRATNRTGFTPSFVFDRRGVAIQKLDFQSARAHAVMDAAGMGTDHPRIKALLDDIQSVIGHPPQVEETTGVPMMIALLAEGYYDPDTPRRDLGKLGLMCSALVREQIDPMLKQARRTTTQVLKENEIAHLVPKASELPKTFTAMTRF